MEPDGEYQFMLEWQTCPGFSLSAISSMNYEWSWKDRELFFFIACLRCLLVPDFTMHVMHLLVGFYIAYFNFQRQNMWSNYIHFWDLQWKCCTMCRQGKTIDHHRQLCYLPCFHGNAADWQLPWQLHSATTC